MIISIDDFYPDNPRIAEIIRQQQLEAQTIFFMDFRDERAVSQIQELDRYGIEIGSHTKTHAKLTKIRPREAWMEIEGSKKIIEDTLKKECKWFAYPFGFYNDEIIKMVKKAGYKYGRLATAGRSKSLFKRPAFWVSYPGGFDLGKTRNDDHYYIHCADLDQHNLWEEFVRFLIWLKSERT